MPGPHPAVARTRLAVREVLAGWDAGPTGERNAAGDLAEPGGDRAARAAATTGADSRRPLALVACSGGPDSVALAAAAAFEAPRAGWRCGAVVVDHGLQEDSAAVAQRAAGTCRGLGLDPVVVVEAPPAGRDDTARGPEAEARARRYPALDQQATRFGAALVLLGHTRDDQAEQVLLGLVRGSGTRSLAGMPARRGAYARPLLGVPRSTTVAACVAQGLTTWDDPHNADPRFTRVRARAQLARMEAELGPGIGAALARSAGQLREDADALDSLAADLVRSLGPTPWPTKELATHPRALRVRALRVACASAGVPLGSLTASHLDALDALLTRWRGQGPVGLPGGVRAARRDGLLQWWPGELPTAR